MLTLLYTNRQLNCRPYGSRTHSSAEMVLALFSLGTRSAPSNLTSLYESFLLLSMQPAGGFSSQPSQALFNKLLVFYPQANGTTQSVFVVDTIASSICGRHIRQCLFRLAIGEGERIRTSGPHFCDQGISNPSHSTYSATPPNMFPLRFMGLEPSPIGGRIKHIK